MNIGQPYIIFSVFQANQDEATNKSNHLRARTDLEARGIKVKELHGQFKGVKELSFAIDVLEQVNVLPLLKKFNQECFALVYGDRYLELRDQNGGLVKGLGYLRTVTKDEAESIDHTFDPSTNTFYAVK